MTLLDIRPVLGVEGGEDDGSEGVKLESRDGVGLSVFLFVTKEARIFFPWRVFGATPRLIGLRALFGSSLKT
jgi:hypothetical protein